MRFWQHCGASLIFSSGLAAPVSAEINIEKVKKLFGDYAAGFISPATDVAYGKRINGPRGTAVLASVDQVKRRMVRDERRTFGYGSGIEDVAYQNGMLLYALLDAHEATSERTFAHAAPPYVRRSAETEYAEPGGGIRPARSPSRRRQELLPGLIARSAQPLPVRNLAIRRI